MATLADVLRYFDAGILDLHAPTGIRDDFERAQDRNARPDQGRVGAAKTRQRNLVDERAEDWGFDDRFIFDSPPTRGFNELFDCLKWRRDVQSCAFGLSLAT